MADMNKFSEQVIDLAERFADITDAAQGKGNRKSMGRAGWSFLRPVRVSMPSVQAAASSAAPRRS